MVGGKSTRIFFHDDLKVTNFARLITVNVGCPVWDAAKAITSTRPRLHCEHVFGSAVLISCEISLALNYLVIRLLPVSCFLSKIFPRSRKKNY